MRSLVLSASSRRVVRLVLGLASLVSALSVVGVVPVAAHDSVSGAPDVTITIRSGLSDRDVQVSVGDIVRFVNRDDDRHRMRSRSGQEFDTGNLEPGDSYQVRLSVAGTYPYLDERNDDAAAYRGRIVVVSGSGSGGSAEGTTPPSGGSESGGSNGAGAASGATVTIGDDFYDPTSVRIAVGGTVEFRNTGGDEHSATSSAFDTGVLGGGASARKTFPTAGTFAFLCIFHSDMRGSIEVVAPSGGGGGIEPVAPLTTPTPTPTATPLPTPAADPTPQLVGAPSEVSVDAADFVFRPATIEVAAGGRVTWTNRGVAPHSVTSKDGSFDSGMLESGATFAQIFATPGSYAYLCAFHPEMTATVRVVAETSGSGVGAANDPAAAPAVVTAPTDATSPPPEAPATQITSESKPATDVSSLAGIVLTVTLVSGAAALFSRAIRGTVRNPDRADRGAASGEVVED